MGGIDHKKKQNSNIIEARWACSLPEHYITVTQLWAVQPSWQTEETERENREGDPERLPPSPCAKGTSQRPASQESVKRMVNAGVE